MARVFAYGGGGATAAPGFGPPWLAVLGMALLSVWAITLAVLLCGDDSSDKPRPRNNDFDAAHAANAGNLAAAAKPRPRHNDFGAARAANAANLASAAATAASANAANAANLAAAASIGSSGGGGGGFYSGARGGGF